MTDELDVAAVAVLPADRHAAAVYLARLAPGSRRTQRGALDAIARWLSKGRLGWVEFPWGAIRYQHAAAVRAWVVEHYAARTANRHVAALRAVVREAWKLGQMPYEEVGKVLEIRTTWVRTPPAGRHVASAELAAVLAAANLRDAALVALLYGAGLRRAECAGLSLGDVNLESGALRVLGKGRKLRTSHLPPWALAIVRKYAERRAASTTTCSVEGPFLVRIVNGLWCDAGITPGSVGPALDRLARRADVAPFTPHDCRRTWISDLLEHGAELVTVSKLAGHEDPAVTAGYDRRREKVRSEAAAKLPEPHA